MVSSKLLKKKAAMLFWCFLLFSSGLENQNTKTKTGVFFSEQQNNRTTEQQNNRKENTRKEENARKKRKEKNQVFSFLLFCSFQTKKPVISFGLVFWLALLFCSLLFSFLLLSSLNSTSSLLVFFCSFSE